MVQPVQTDNLATGFIESAILDTLNLFNPETQKEVLQVLADEGKINIASPQIYKQMKERNKYFQMHKNKITQKKDGRWSTRLPLIERGEIQKKTFPIIKRTEKELYNAIVDHYKQIDVNPTLYDLYYEYQRKNVDDNKRQESTFTRNMSDFKRFFNEFGKCRILDIGSSDIKTFLINQKQDKDLTRKSYNRMTQVLSCIFGYAKALGIIDYKIKDIIEETAYINSGFKEEKKSDKEMVFNEDETALLVNHFIQNQSPYNLGLLLCIVTGIRGGELSSLIRGECTSEYLYIHQTESTYIQSDTGKLICDIRNQPKTKKGIRYAKIPESFSWIVPKIKQLFPSDCKWLFMTRNHKTGELVRARAEYFRKALYKACDIVGIPRRGLHCLRRTYSSIVTADGSVSETTLTEQLGHENISTTFQHYVKNRKTNEDMREELSNVKWLKNLTKPCQV